MENFSTGISLDTTGFISGLNKVIAAANKAGTDVAKALQLDTAKVNTTGAVNELKKVEVQAQSTKGSLGGFDKLFASFKDGQVNAGGMGSALGGIAGTLGSFASPVGAATAAIGALTAGFAATLNIGKEFETNIQAVSAVTGLTGSDLDKLGDRAVDLSKKFGGDASTQLKAFQGVLSRFGADLAKTPEALGAVADNINVLAKAGGLDAAQSMDVLSNSMLQFGVDVANPQAAMQESSRYINVLAASARVGAAEIPQVGEAVLVAGVAAKQANVSFEETNAAIQVLAAGGKVGAEAGTALRNVLGKIAGEDVVPKEAAAKLKKLGVNFKVLGDTTLPLSARLNELKKAQGDATAIAQLFGTENASAASILINGTGTIKDWTKEITNTNDAQEQASKNMATFSEAMGRLKANIEAVAIKVYKVIAPALTFLANAFSNLFSSDANPLQPLIDSFEKVYAQVKPIIDVLINNVLKALELQFFALKSAAGIVFDALSNLFSGVASAFKPLVDKFKELFGAVGDGSSVLDTIKSALSGIYKVIGGALNVAIGIFVKSLSLIVQYSASVIGILIEVGKWVGNTATKFYDWVNSFTVVKVAIALVTKQIQDFIGWVKGAYDTVVKFLGLSGEQAVNTKGQEKQVEANTAVTKTVEEQTKAVETNASAKEKADKQSKSQLQTAQETLKNKKKEYDTELDILQIKLKEQAAAEGRKKLSDDELLQIAQLKKTNSERLLADAKSILGITNIVDGLPDKTSIKFDVSKGESFQQIKDTYVDLRETLANDKLALNVDIGTFEEQVTEVVKKIGDKSVSVEARVTYSAEQVDKFKKLIEKLKSDLEGATDINTKDRLQKQFDDANNSIKKLFAAQSKLDDDAKEEGIKRDDKLRAARIAGIEDANKREIELKIFSLEKQQREELDNELLTEQEKYTIRKRFEKQIEELRKGAPVDTNGLTSAYSIAIKTIKGDFQDLSDFFSSSITRSTGSIGAGLIDIAPAELLRESIGKMSGDTSDLVKQLQAVQGEEKALTEGFIAGTANYRDSADKIAELATKKAELEKQIEDKKMTFIKSLYVSLYSELSKLSEQYAIEQQKSLQKLADANKAYSEAQINATTGVSDRKVKIAKLEEDVVKAQLEVEKSVSGDQRAEATKTYNEKVLQLNDLKKQQVEAGDKLKNAELAQSEARTAALETLTANFGAQALTLLATGQNVSKELGKLAYNTVSSLIDMYVPGILAGFLSFLGPFALPAAGLAIAGIKALLKSVAGFEHGGLVEGQEQIIRINERGQEYVTNAQATKKNIGLLEHINKGGDARNYLKNELSKTSVSASGDLLGSAAVSQLQQMNSRLQTIEQRLSVSNSNSNNVNMKVGYDKGVLLSGIEKSNRIKLLRN